jgi:hypothetical protein
MDPADLGLKPLKLEVKINSSSFKLFFSGICHSDEKLTNTEAQSREETCQRPTAAEGQIRHQIPGPMIHSLPVQCYRRNFLNEFTLISIMATGLEHIFIIIFNGYQQGIQQMRVKL